MVRLLRTKIGPKGQAVIPKALRDRFGIRPGDHLEVDATGDAITLRKPEGTAEVEAFLSAIPKRRLGRVDWRADLDSQWDASSAW